MDLTGKVSDSGQLHDIHTWKKATIAVHGYAQNLVGMGFDIPGYLFKLNN